MWNILVNAGHLDDLQKGRITEGELIDYARALLPYGDILEQVETAPEPKDKRPLVEPLQLGGYEEERASTLARFLELKVAAHPSVLRFVLDRLPVRWPLSYEDAYLMADSTNVREAWSGIRGAEPGEGGKIGCLEFFSRSLGEPVDLAFAPGPYSRSCRR